MKELLGKPVAEALSGQLRARLNELNEAHQRMPRLDVVVVGHNPASMAYVGRIQRACDKYGFDNKVHHFQDDVQEQQLLYSIDLLNHDEAVDGIIIQMPLPKGISQDALTAALDPAKDVDVFHPANLGKIMMGTANIFPATPHAVIELLRYYKIPTQGKHAVILGRSRIVGLPLANMLIQKQDPGDCTVTVCHSRTNDLPAVLRSADILVVAMGKPLFVKEDMVKEGATVIDVGINSVPDPASPNGHKIVGDVDFERVAPRCQYISPVPGGVGPVTNMMLLYHTLQSRESRK